MDGIPQLRAATKVEKPANFQRLPKVPKFDKEAAEAVEHDGLPPLEPMRKVRGTVVFTNVKSVYRPGGYGVQQQFMAQSDAELGVAVVQNGTIACSGLRDTCRVSSLMTDPDVAVVDLDGGSVSPGFVSYGAPLGLEEILLEPSTTDGFVPDALVQPVPMILGGDFLLVHAADGLQFGTRGAL